MVSTASTPASVRRGTSPRAISVPTCPEPVSAPRPTTASALTADRGTKVRDRRTGAGTDREPGRRDDDVVEAVDAEHDAARPERSDASDGAPLVTLIANLVLVAEMRPRPRAIRDPAGSPHRR